jgi:IrrE N-terminal-like domain
VVTKRSWRSRQRWTSAAARRLLQLADNAKSIEEAAEKVVGKFLEGVGTAPTDLETLATRLNIEAFAEADMPFSGELRRDGAGFTIVYSRFLSPARRRFTIAHEMGHAIFEGTGPNCPRQGAELERLCDLLAAEILMPRQVFLQHAIGKPSVGQIMDLARRFQTSISSTARRYAELRNLTVFQVEDGEVLWSVGVVRKGAVNQLHPPLARAVADSIATRRHSDELLYYPAMRWHGEWKLEGIPVGQGAGLFILRPFPPTVARLETSAKSP